MNKIQQLAQEYFKILSQQDFDPETLDYSIFDQQRAFLDQMAKVKGSGLTVFDLHTKTHIYNSYSLQELFGYDIERVDNQYYNSRVHPDDLHMLMRIGMLALKESYKLPISERKNYKLQNEYRVLNAQDKYIRIIEQFQTLELDPKGNLWLALTVIDISPNQEHYDGVRSQWINTKTGDTKVIDQKKKANVALSNREAQVLSFIQNGFLSKEISEKLSISLHTVNTHRQNILKKLGANNSLEAIKYANQLNLL